jgi:hypothetical protein
MTTIKGFITRHAFGGFALARTCCPSSTGTFLFHSCHRKLAPD